MDKQSLIKVFKIENLSLGFIVSAVAIIIGIFGEGAVMKGMAIGMAIGLWIGVGINHYIQIPKVYGNKDERELILMIIAVSLGMGIALIGTIILLSMTVVDAISFTPVSYMFTMFGIVGISLAVRFGSYKLLDNYL